MGVAKLVGNEVETPSLSQTQVYKVTHEGQNYLPFMQRSFISFSYGGKNIEDFNLIAVNRDDRMERNLYADFNDLTTSYDIIQGEFYWGTHYATNSLELELATDGMTQRDLDDFKLWFRAGQVKELILAEHPNRAIMARVATPPQMSMIPFEQKITIPIAMGESVFNYDTSTTLYRGNITLEFVMDEPFWYAKQNLLGLQDVVQGNYKERWIDANGIEVDVRNTPDALKIIYEDRIPLGSTVAVSVFLGGNTYATVKYDDISALIAEAITDTEYDNAVSNALLGIERESYIKIGSDGSVTTAFAEAENANNVSEPDNSDTSEGDDSTEPTGDESNDPSEEEPTITYSYYKGASIARQYNGNYIGGKIGGAEIAGSSENVEGITLLPGDMAQLYYAGTAPSPVKMQFTLKPLFRSDFVIQSPNNKYGTPEVPYNTISLTATREHKFQFSLPLLYASYQQVLQIFDNESVLRDNLAWLTVRETIRDTVKDAYVRAWANKIIDAFDTSTGIIVGADDIRGELKRGMMYMFLDANGESNVLPGDPIPGMPATFVFDGKTGRATGQFKIRNPYKTNLNLAMANGDSIAEKIQQVKDDPDTFIDIVQNVGDMVKSNYLMLDERNVLDSNFQVQQWTTVHPDYAYLITHNLSSNLENVHFEFKNLYL